MNGNSAKLWIILGRPTRLPSALIAVHALADRFPGGCHLLRDESQWWERAHWQQFAKHFAGVHAFPRVKSCRGLIDLPRLYRETAGRKSAVAALPVNRETDTLLCLASIVGLGNVGRRIAKLCATVFDMKVLAYDPYLDEKTIAERNATTVVEPGWCAEISAGADLVMRRIEPRRERA